VSVDTDAEKLHVHAAEGGDQGIVTGSFGGRIGVGAVGKIYVFGEDIDLIEKVFMHEIGVALVVIGSETAVLVEVDGLDVLEGDLAASATLGKLLVEAEGRGAGSKAEDAVGLEDELGAHDVGGLGAHFFVIFANVDFHDIFLLLGFIF
jgi:hypothetical protein